ncbi:MAG: SMP-30/gluconolactonase/LRE family protein [Chloroflexota bacterium]|nr:SMP-30/gluconolactonase/LRE family protein [Chloroflexota bacterium]
MPPPLPRSLRPAPVVSGIAFAEGPTFDRRGDLYFVNYLRLGTIGRLPADGGEAEVWVEMGGQANGLKCDAAGRIVCADFGAKRITRFDTATRAMEVLTDSYGGEPYLGPNDLCLDQAGNVYFSDPVGSSAESPTGAVYRIGMDAAGRLGGVRRVADNLAFPNGLAVHPDGRRLFVAETGTNRLLCFNIAPGGGLANERTTLEFATPSLDGIAFDEHGRLWVARWVNGTVDVVDVDAGRLLASYPVGDRATNLCWRGESVYITVAGLEAIVRLDAGVRGYDPVG